MYSQEIHLDVVIREGVYESKIVLKARRSGTSPYKAIAKIRLKGRGEVGEVGPFSKRGGGVQKCHF